jgi:hypothetical protein
LVLRCYIHVRWILRLDWLHRKCSESIRSIISWWPMRLPVAVAVAVAISSRTDEDSMEEGVASVVAMEVAAVIPTTPTAIISAKSVAS